MSIAASPQTSTAGPVLTTPPRSTRLIYLDNLKIVLVAGVILAHAFTINIEGGGLGGAGLKGGINATMLMGAIGALAGLFWLGLFFLISGLFAPASLVHHGPGGFFHERLKRLGIPLLLYIVIVMPVMDYARYRVEHGGQLPFWTWVGNKLIHFGPYALNPGIMWFVAILLLLSAGYALWWHFHPGTTAHKGELRLRDLALLAAAIAVTSFVFRLQWALFSREAMDLHVWQWPQYFLLFWFGTLAGRRGWLTRLSDRLWYACGLGIVASAVGLAILGWASYALVGDLTPLSGGWHWQALGMAFIEGVLAVAGSLWVLDLFRRFIDGENSLSRQLARSAYGAFVVHEPILIALYLTLPALPIPVQIKFALFAVIGIIVSYALAWLLVARLRLAAGIL